MRNQPVCVAFCLVGRDGIPTPRVGLLVFEGDQPFAEAVDVGNGTPSFQPPRIKLRPDDLELMQEESAGRPAWYRYDGLVVEME